MDSFRCTPHNVCFDVVMRRMASFLSRVGESTWYKHSSKLSSWRRHYMTVRLMENGVWNVWSRRIVKFQRRFLEIIVAVAGDTQTTRSIIVVDHVKTRTWWRALFASSFETMTSGWIMTPMSRRGCSTFWTPRLRLFRRLRVAY